MSEEQKKPKTATAGKPPRFHVSLREAPHKRAICETKMRYDILLNGEFFEDLYYNMRGYVGGLPLPDGRVLVIGERGVSAYRTEIRRINREAKEATKT